MYTNEVINCVREHLDKWYVGNNHNETAIQLVNEYEKCIRADERAKTIDEVEKLYRDWLYSEYGKKADTDNLTIRVITHFKEQK